MTEMTEGRTITSSERPSASLKRKAVGCQDKTVEQTGILS